jgi:hypothetical protein
MKKLVFIATLSTLALSAPAFADEVGVGVGVGPVGAGVTVGESHDHYRHRERTIIREREPRDRTVVIKKHRPEVERKTIIHEHDD